MCCISNQIAWPLCIYHGINGTRALRRGAGAIFRNNGKLFRPSQDCGKHYGYSFTLNEIVVWDRYQYQEKPCVTANPEWAQGLVGTHTYSHLGQCEIIDGCVPLPAGMVRGLH